MTQTAPVPIIRLFKPGQFVSAEGQSLSFSEADLLATAAAYDAEADPAPLVAGHPRHNDPAMGWVKRVFVQDGHLFAEAGDIETSFAEQVRTKRFRKVSVQFYPPTSRHNPTPGAWALKHVGFLGAMAPAVKGLGTVSFGEDADVSAATVNTKAEDSLVTDTNTTPAPTPTPTPAPAAAEASFTERQAKLDARQKELDDRDAAAATTAAEARHAANASFAEDQVKAGKLKPAGTALVVGLLDQLDHETPASFGEGVELAPADALRKLFDDANPVVSFGAHPDSGAPDAVPTASFSAPEGFSASEDKAALHAKAKALQAKEPGLSMIAAVKRVEAGA